MNCVSCCCCYRSTSSGPISVHSVEGLVANVPVALVGYSERAPLFFFVRFRSVVDFFKLAFFVTIATVFYCLQMSGKR